MPQSLVLGPLFFPAYINDLVENVSSDAKLFADNTSLFTIVYDEGTAADQLNRDLKSYSTGLSMENAVQALQKLTSYLGNFPQKRLKPAHPPIFLNESQVKIKHEQKTLI